MSDTVELNERARQLISERRFGDALGILNQARAAAANDAQSWALTGLAKAGWGDASGASEALARARELGPNLAEAHAASGEAALLAQDWAGALVHFRRAASVGSLTPDYSVGMAVALRETDDTEGALKTLESVQTSAGDKGRATKELALTYLARGVKEWKRVPDENYYIPTSLQEIARAREWFDKADRLRAADSSVAERLSELSRINKRALDRTYDGSTPVLVTLVGLGILGILMAGHNDFVGLAYYFLPGAAAYAASSYVPRYLVNARMGRETFLSRLFGQAMARSKEVEPGDIWAAGAMAGGGALSSGAAMGHFAAKGLMPLFLGVIFAFMWPLLVALKVLRNWVFPLVFGR